jgi:hypothetical protein
MRKGVSENISIGLIVGLTVLLTMVERLVPGGLRELFQQGGASSPGAPAGRRPGLADDLMGAAGSWRLGVVAAGR